MPIIDMEEKKLYIENGKRAWLEELYTRGLCNISKIGKQVFEDAVILPIRDGFMNDRYIGEGGVVDKDGNYIEDSVISFGFGGAYVPEFETYCDRTAVYLGSDHGAWGHFLVDVVPRLWYVLKEDEANSVYVMIRSESSDTTILDNELDFFRCLGIDDRVKVINTPIRFRRVIVPQRSYNPDLSERAGETASELHPFFLETFDYVRNALLSESDSVGVKTSKNVFFTRSGLSETHWHDTGIEILDSFFRNNGYEIVSPEKIGLKELVHMLSKAERVAYLSGTLQHNMLFAPDGIRALCIERKPMLVGYQTDIDLIKKLDVTYVSGTYSFWPGNVSISGMYAWTDGLSRYAEDQGMELLDTEYTRYSFFEKTLNSYISEFIKCDEWTTINGMKRYFECIYENRKEAIDKYPRLRFRQVSVDECSDNRLMMEDFGEELIFRGIPYYNWKDVSYFDFCNTAVRIIDYALRDGKRDFYIYPYGNLGMLFDEILEKRYGIIPAGIYDQKASKYRDDICRIEELSILESENKSVVILCTRNQECLMKLKEKELKCEIISPYTLI